MSAPRYTCPLCGSGAVQLNYPCWVPANDMENRERWELDIEAQPYDDSHGGWCTACEELVLVHDRERDGEPSRPNGG